MKSPLFIKIFTGYLTVILILYLLVTFISFRSIKTHYYNDLKSTLEHFCRTFVIEIDPVVKDGRSPRLSERVKQLGDRSGLRITVIALNGDVYADTDKDPELMERHDDRPEIRQAATNTVGMATRPSTTLKQDMMYVALAVDDSNGRGYYIRSSEPVSEINILVSSLRKEILKITGIILCLALLSAYLLSRKLTRPLYELTQTAQKVTAGDMDARVNYRNRDEIGELARYFNTMVERGRNLFTELSHQKDALNLIITNLQEGLLVTDSDGTVMLYNDSFTMLTGITLKTGKFYWESIRNPELVRFIESVFDNKKNMQQEITIGTTHLMCLGFISPADNQTVITLHDITDIVAMAKMKKDFVTNVSHELRTPLTSIKGYVETAMESADEETGYYLKIISRNTDRLINIVHDLLQLSKLEQENNKLEVEEVNISQLIDNVLKGFEHRIKEKGLTISFEPDDQYTTVSGDYFKLEQVFINLVDNAVKYTETGTIRISVTGNGMSVSISVSDTGIGIPPQDLSHIFERFYVIDKSRSRQMGGTGLGLSIVKHIVLLHDGQVDVKSEPGTGSTFTIILPLTTAAE
jgi:two-component system phosphate regulon sensor histidine kinase PhoR